MTDLDDNWGEDRGSWLELCPACGARLEHTGTSPFGRWSTRWDINEDDQARDRNEFELPRRPLHSGRHLDGEIMGVWISTPTCVHCSTDDTYFKDTGFVPMLDELRSTPRESPVDHAEYLASEISTLEKFLGVTDALSVPEFVREEMIALMNDPARRSAVAGVGSNHIGPFGVTTPEVIAGYDPHTETATVRMPISRMVRLLGARGPRPLTVVWQRYRELWEEHQGDLRDAEYAAEFNERIRWTVDQTFSGYLGDDPAKERE